ncbi:MAG: ATP phosphoribosyltransferase regulatory subunit, partial [Thermomicrobiaceae bacterium]
QTSEADDVRRAFDFISELIQVQGPPETVLPDLRTLVRRHELQESPIEEIETTLELLSAYGANPENVELNLGLGRGLHYYTGILFEIYDPGRPWLQLCGGGRYDELAQSLGARERIPACGFSYGVERIVEASNWQETISPPEILMVEADASSSAAVARVSEQLRAQGHIVEIDVRGRSANASRRYAQRRGIERIIAVDSDGETREENVSARSTIGSQGEAV